MAATENPNAESTVIYRECALNPPIRFTQTKSVHHGCNEFKPGLGSLLNPEFMICLDCGCPRSFHRKIVIHPGCSFNPSTLPPPPPPMNRKPPMIGSITGKEYRKLVGKKMAVERRPRRKRTYLSAIQKQKAMEFMEKYNWKKIPRSQQGEVRRFCQEMEIELKVFRYWMDNTKRRRNKTTRDLSK